MCVFNEFSTLENKYLEIIKNIEIFEQDAYKKCKSINTFDNEINSIEDKLNVLNSTELTELIDELKNQIEIVLFSNNPSSSALVNISATCSLVPT